MLKYDDDNGIIKSIKEKFFLLHVAVSSSSSLCLISSHFYLFSQQCRHVGLWHDTVVDLFIWCDNCWPNLTAFVCLDLKTHHKTLSDGFEMSKNDYTQLKSHLLSGRSLMCRWKFSYPINVVNEATSWLLTLNKKSLTRLSWQKTQNESTKIISSLRLFV